jgi:dienelactone hydrolase
MKNLAFLAIVFMTTAGVDATVIEKEVVYKQDSSVFKGYVAYDNALKGRHPGIIVIHEWWGLNDFVKSKAKELAVMGYVAFAPDMYGDGKMTTDPQTAMKMAGAVRGTPLMRRRAALAFTTLRAMANVDTTNMVAMGFCFGGTAALELAYSGADLKGVVVFHAGLVSARPEEYAAIKPKILVLHGADDPYAPADTIANFQRALRESKVDWQMVYFGNAVHAFTNPANGTDNSKGLAYNPAAAKRSWTYMRDFLNEVLAPMPK